MKSLTLFALLFTVVFSVKAQEIINLYSGTIPNSKEGAAAEPTGPVNLSMIREVGMPTIEAFLPEKEKATGAAIIITPGGGYSVIVYQGEGVSTAKELAQRGIATFVLKYRLPVDTKLNDKKIGPLQDAQQAIKVVRENAAKWGIDPAKIGIMGFSAGGHLASTLATHYKQALVDNPNNTNLRPDFQILIYPVVTMQENLTHADSRKQLLGTDPTKETVDLFSNELQVDQQTPVAFLIHAADDRTVDVDNSINYFEALRKNKVAVEMHIYPRGGHGFRPKGWADLLVSWMINSKIITEVK